MGYSRYWEDRPGPWWGSGSSFSGLPEDCVCPGWWRRERRQSLAGRLEASLSYPEGGMAPAAGNRRWSTRTAWRKDSNRSLCGVLQWRPWMRYNPYYKSGARPIPKTVWLACIGYESLRHKAAWSNGERAVMQRDRTSRNWWLLRSTRE